MTKTRRLLVCLAFAALFALPAASRAAQSADPRAVAASVSRALNVQERLPSDGGEDNIDRTDGGGFGGAEPGSGASQAGSAGWGPVLVSLAAIGVLGLVALLVSYASESLGGRFGTGASGDQPGNAATGGAAAPRAVLSTADELAAAGRYTEAMHQLLGDALAALRRRRDAEISDALTSREILRALALQPVQHDALRDMIARVEQTWFAQRAAALADYDAVRASFRAFTGTGAASA